ncbi:MAG TPA: thioredoxin family protein [Candidatus Dadabacteria bacterium]|nr:thioredoxin family protein [Candidatus Dadabacteria bacterium]
MELGEKLVNFRLKSTDDTYFDSNDISPDKKLIIFFTCNHCPYVHAYEKRIINLQKKYSETCIFVGINSNDGIQYPEDSFEKMKTRYKKMNYNFFYLRDEDQVVAKTFGATHTPHFFVFNKKRVLIYRGKLDDNWNDETKVKIKYLENSIISNDSILNDTFPVGCTIKWR